jgi:hypothetical protein
VRSLGVQRVAQTARKCTARTLFLFSSLRSARPAVRCGLAAWPASRDAVVRPRPILSSSLPFHVKTTQPRARARPGLAEEASGGRPRWSAWAAAPARRPCASRPRLSAPSVLALLVEASQLRSHAVTSLKSSRSRVSVVGTVPR